MARYDFKSLSSQDFEELIRDLLQAEWNIPLEAFRQGRDQGIDLRYAPAEGARIIIQCKHYATSGFPKLLTHLRDIELPKIRRLIPARYVVATSVSLTPGNKDEIITALQPFVLSVRDVIGADDIEGLLSLHPDVEQANFKLWLTSTRVIDRVLHNATLCQTDFEVDRIRGKLPLFVKSDAYPRATEILDRTRILVVTGAPGIGKTTLAEILLYAHLEDGYEPIAIKAEIAEAKNLFKATRKQIFYYDDFLGQIFLGDRSEYLGRNQDASLVDFIEMISRSPQSRFILTTREHILSGAIQESERLAQSLIMEHRCLLELKDYSYAHRARLLYNHLYFSDLPQEYKGEVLREDFFLDIIKHQHFNPRLIEWMSAFSRLRQVPAKEYRTHVLGLLESPETIWSYAFTHQISDAARHVLLSFNSLGGWTHTVDIEPAFMALHRHNAAKYQHQTRVGDYKRALQELDGAFLSYNKGYASYLNPSVQDFVTSVISDGREIVEDLINSAVRFKQIANLWKLGAARQGSELRTFLTTDAYLLCRSSSRLLTVPSMRWEKQPNGSLRGYPIDTSYEERIGFLAEVAAAHGSSELAQMASQLADILIGEWEREVVKFRPVIRLMVKTVENRWFLDHGGREVYQRLLEGVLDALNFANADDWLDILAFPSKALEWSDKEQQQLEIGVQQYVQEGVSDERYDCTTLDELVELRESLDKLQSEYDLPLDRHIKLIDEDIAEREWENDDPQEGSGYGRGGVHVTHDLATDDEVREMFSTLRDGA
jgi:hypothetical protein